MRALICGISGQDGAYLAQLLLGMEYTVVGTSRDVAAYQFANLTALNIKNEVELLSMDITDFRSVLYVIEKVKPDEIYNLAGQTSVGLSFDQPVEAMESIGFGTLNLLEAIRFTDPSISFYNAGSSDCFGDTGDLAATEETPFRPRSPYGVAKASAHFLVQNYREAYGLYACSGVLFNHESTLRPQRFVTQKIVSAAARIHAGSQERLELGNLSISRDWGWAPDYVEAMWRMLQQNNPEDFIVATGKTISLEQFVDISFAYFNLNWKDYVDLKKSLMRPLDIAISRGDPAKSNMVLGWVHTLDVTGVIDCMCRAASDRLES
ncbi:MAG: GDPmannose 4,6-dehydratase [Planctomycetota bacterium]|jgi:GDPmannose 4,6-dehydratase